MRLLQIATALASVATLVSARETVEDAARLARQLVAGTGISSLATVFPEDHPTLGGQALSLMEYHASCYSNGSLTVIFTPISLNSKNILKSQTHSATITVVETPTRASNARVALMGTMEIFFDIDATLRDELADCYTAVHPDAKRWIPGTVDAHPSWWARFDPHTAYWIGGFGGLHYIGYVPIDLYQSSGNATKTTGGLRIQA